MKRQHALAIVAFMLTFLLGNATGIGLADEGNVEERIARFWARVDAMQPTDYLGASDLGQWALNVIERDPRARLTVADFRNSTAGMQAALDRAGPAPVSGATPTPAPTTTFATFSDGTKVVGTQLPAGTYRTRTQPAGLCYWARLSGFGGTTAEIIANDATNARSVVTIAAADKGFNTQGCGTWTSDLSAVTANPTAAFGAGTYIVGVDIAAGTWQSSGTSSCYWSRLSGFGGTTASIIANDFASGASVVQIAATDKGFSSSGCGTWTKIG